MVTLMQRALVILQVFAASQMAGVSDEWLAKVKKKRSSPDNHAATTMTASVDRLRLHHWGTLRARLELAVETVLEKVMLLHCCSCATPHLDSADSSRVDVQVEGRIEAKVGGGGVNKSSPSSLRSLATRSNEDAVVLPGRQIALPVQHLHDLSLRGMLLHEKPEGLAHQLEHEQKWLSPGPASDEDGQSDRVEFLRAEAQRMVARVVRRHLSPALWDLIEHGLVKRGLSEDGLIHRSGFFLLRPLLGCLKSRKTSTAEEDNDNDDADAGIVADKAESAGMASPGRRPAASRQRAQRRHNGTHAWQVLLHFYYMKNGHLYNETPARKLSESFNLDTVGGKAITTRQRFFNAIGVILEAHTAHLSSDDAKFKAFVSIALNERKLVPWLRLVLTSPAVVDRIYEPWSYTKSTGFKDALHSLDRLSKVDFHLPANYTLGPPSDCQDAF